MTNGTDIAAEIRAGMIEAGEATGGKRLNCVLKKRVLPATPWVDDSAVETTFDVIGTRTKRIERDGISQVRRLIQMLLIDATGVQPEKGDFVAIGFTSSEVDLSTPYVRIGEVNTVQPGDTPLLYKVDLDD